MQFTLTIELDRNQPKRIREVFERWLYAHKINRMEQPTEGYGTLYDNEPKAVGSWQVRETPKEGSGRFTDCGRPTGSPYEGQD